MGSRAAPRLSTGRLAIPSTGSCCCLGTAVLCVRWGFRRRKFMSFANPLAPSPRLKAPGGFAFRPPSLQAVCRHSGLGWMPSRCGVQSGCARTRGYPRSPSGVQRESTRSSDYNILYLILLKSLCCVFFIMCLIYQYRSV